MAETSKTIAFRIPCETHEQIREAAAAANLSPGEWARRLVLEALYGSIEPATSSDGEAAAVNGSLVVDPSSDPESDSRIREWDGQSHQAVTAAADTSQCPPKPAAQRGLMPDVFEAFGDIFTARSQTAKDRRPRRRD